jgi:diguanylate cyclase (GGDEF)-like protein/PAS domain S-box-containing protein
MTPIRILVADDEPTSRVLMQAALRKSGFEVTLAVDGNDALRQFRAGPCDMVMLDVDMPGLNGYQVCAELRKEAGDELPIVMVTGMDDIESIERAYESGATDFMAKPINWSLIGHRVRYLFRAYLALIDLRAAHARNAAILKAIPDLMFEMDMDGRYLDCHSPRSDLLAAPAEVLLGNTVADVMPADAAAVCMAALREANDKGFSTGKQLELPVEAGRRWFELSVAHKASGPGEKARFIVLSRDITERKEAESRIFKLAYFDGLTGLPNRQFFLERLERDIGRAGHHGDMLAVLFLDLDGFKGINDTLGHGAGDLILQWTAERLRAGLRPSDLVARTEIVETEVELARLGGDEFSVLLPNLGHSEDAMIVAHRIRTQMARPFDLEGREVVLTASIGIAIYPDDGTDAETLLKHADTAMYHAKDEGRDNCQYYSKSLTQQALQRLNMTTSLRLALERDEFFLVYQPQFDVATGRVHSVEALIRWRHPEQGLVSPARFIPMAEENGLIVPIGEWVLRSACRDAAGWQREGGRLRVAVNLSPVQFRNPGLLASIRAILAETGLAPELLELEVTEGALMEYSEATLATLQALRDGGMQIALDDFGTGYSSMSYLKRLPLHNLKVDQSFVQCLPDDTDSLAIVKAIVSLAKNLGFTVTAEGVETLDQASILKGLDCETLQGYYFSKPIPGNDIVAILARRWPIDALADERHDNGVEAGP